MRKHYIKLSDLWATAQKEVFNYTSSLDKPSKIISSFMGSPVTNKQWLNNSKSLLNKAQLLKGSKRINLLMNALLDIYKCEILMKNSPFFDKNVISLRSKIETSYMNSILIFIDDFFEGSSSVNSKHIKEAIAVLEEKNQKLAKNYTKAYEININFNKSTNLINEIFNLPPDSVSVQHLIQIKAYFQAHSKLFETKKAVINQVKKNLEIFINSLSNYYKDKIDLEKNKEYPSIINIMNNYNFLNEIRINLESIIAVDLIAKALVEKDSLVNIVNFINITYPKLLKTYKYYSLPRKKIDIELLLSCLTEIDNNFNYIKFKYKEFEEISNNLPKFKRQFEDTLATYYKKDLINFYEIHNQILNSETSTTKTKEIINFIKYLTTHIKLKSNHKYITVKLSTIKTSMTKELYSIFDSILSKAIESKNNDVVIKEFDIVLAYLIELGHVDAIERLQLYKSEVLKNFQSNNPLPKFSLTGDNVNKESELYDEQHDATINESPKTFSRLVILDNFKLHNYVIFTNSKIIFGRSDKNDIILKCEWISNEHCLLDFDRKFLLDLGSTNGTYHNNIKIHEVNITPQFEFNLSDTLSFRLTQFDHSFKFRLTQVTDLQLLREKPEYLDSLLNTDFIYLEDSNKFTLNKITGEINKPYSDQDEILEFSYLNNSFYLTDYFHNLINVSIDENFDSINDRFSITLL